MLRDVKALADALGARRDPDVELLALEQFAVSVGPDERPGVELFIERTRAEQSDGNRLPRRGLAQAERSDLRGRIAALAALAARPGQRRRPRRAHARTAGRARRPSHARRRARRAAATREPRGRPDEAQRELLADRVYGLNGEPA